MSGSDMDAVRTAEFKEAFDEFDKVYTLVWSSSFPIIISFSIRTAVAPSQRMSCFTSSSKEPLTIQRR